MVGIYTFINYYVAMNTLRNDLSYNLTQFRLNSGLTQEQTAELIGISTKYYGLIERGRRIPSDVLLSRISEVTGISITSLNPDCQMHICPCQVRNKKKLFFQKYWGTFSKIPQYYFFSI